VIGQATFRLETAKLLTRPAGTLYSGSAEMATTNGATTSMVETMAVVSMATSGRGFCHVVLKRRIVRLWARLDSLVPLQTTSPGDLCLLRLLEPVGQVAAHYQRDLLNAEDWARYRGHAVGVPWLGGSRPVLPPSGSVA